MTSFREVVAAYHHESAALLVASTAPCISLAYNEARSLRGGTFQIVSPEHLDDVTPTKSWIMAVILCPGDTTETLGRWVRTTGADVRRFLFYTHPSTDVAKALGAWHAAGMVVHSLWTVASWKEFHRHFAPAWNLRVFDDFRPKAPRD